MPGDPGHDLERSQPYIDAEIVDGPVVDGDRSLERATAESVGAEIERRDERWLPDEQLVSSILAGSGRQMADLALPDRCWAVAGLGLRGLTAEDIADRMGCSLRLVRSIRAEDMTKVCELIQTESKNFADELRLVRSDLAVTLGENADLQSELTRTRGQLSRMIDSAIVGAKLCGKCGHPMDKYNTYEQPSTGKKFCRTCHRNRQRDYRAGKRVATAGPAEISAEGMENEGINAIVAAIRGEQPIT